MTSNSPSKFDLHQAPTSRERIILFVGIFALIFFFYKSCVVESSKSISSLQEDIAKSLAEQEELIKANVVVHQKDEPTLSDAKAIASKLNWIGSKKSADSSSDALLQAAQENGAVLIKFSLPDYKDKKDYMFKPVSIVLAGTLADLGRYIETSEHLAVPLVIESLSLEPNNEFAEIVTLRIEGGFYATK